MLAISERMVCVYQVVEYFFVPTPSDLAKLKGDRLVLMMLIEAFGLFGFDQMFCD